MFRALVTVMSHRRLVALLALFEMATLSIVTANVWFFAFRNGGRVTVHVDLFGEMWVEYVLWLVLTPVLVLGLHYALAFVLDGPGPGEAE